MTADEAAAAAQSVATEAAILKGGGTARRHTLGARRRAVNKKRASAYGLNKVRMWCVHNVRGARAASTQAQLHEQFTALVRPGKMQRHPKVFSFCLVTCLLLHTRPLHGAPPLCILLQHALSHTAALSFCSSCAAFY